MRSPDLSTASKVVLLSDCSGSTKKSFLGLSVSSPSAGLEAARSANSRMPSDNVKLDGGSAWFILAT